MQCKTVTYTYTQIQNDFDFITGEDHNTSWRKHIMEKDVLSDQTGFLSGQNLSLARQMTCLLTKIIYRLDWSAGLNNLDLPQYLFG